MQPSKQSSAIYYEEDCSCDGDSSSPRRSDRLAWIEARSFENDIPNACRLPRFRTSSFLEASSEIETVSAPARGSANCGGFLDPLERPFVALRLRFAGGRRLGASAAAAPAEVTSVLAWLKAAASSLLRC